MELEPFHIEVATIPRPGQTRTDIQTDWVTTNYIKKYNQAPTSIKAMYGGEAFLEYMQKITDRSTFACPQMLLTLFTMRC